MQMRTLVVIIILFFSIQTIVYADAPLITQINIETYKGAKVEWVNDPVHSGNEAIRMHFSEPYGYAIVKVPYNSQLSSVESVSFTVKYTYARPRFALIIDKNDDGTADTLLLSDYSQNGNNQWTQIWGGSRWGWDETDYPMSTYGGPWQSLSTYKAMYPNIVVKDIGIVAEYWAFEPDGVSDFL